MLSMTLYLIGLGLWDEKDISLKGLEIAKKCHLVYLEQFTSKLMGTNIQKISNLIGKEVIPLDRKAIEETQQFIDQAKEKDVALLVGGDPTVATTHIEIILTAKSKNIPVKEIHAASVYTAVSESGLIIYNFGKACSIPFPEKNFQPESFYDTILLNQKNGLHTMVFLDLRPEENKYMTINQALKIILDIAKKRNNEINEESIAVGFARLGSEDQIIKAGKIKELINFNFGGPLHILVIPGKLFFKEKEALGLND